MLIVLSGLPGTGKTAIAQILAHERHATYLRIDTIEQAILSSLRVPSDLNALGYVVAYELARANLCLGGTVVADAVNPLTAIREAWRAVAENATSDIIEVEVVCSDKSEHRRRVDSRKADISGHTLPTWDEVQRREYEPWASNRLVIDSAQVSAKDAASQILDSIKLRQ
jgi:predicted kinase